MFSWRKTKQYLPLIVKTITYSELHEFQTAKTCSNNADPYQMLHFAASDQGPHCLLIGIPYMNFYTKYNKNEKIIRNT